MPLFNWNAEGLRAVNRRQQEERRLRNASEANDRSPNVGLFEPGRIIYQARDAERAKAERNKRKIFVEQP